MSVKNLNKKIFLLIFLLFVFGCVKLEKLDVIVHNDCTLTFKSYVNTEYTCYQVSQLMDLNRVSCKPYSHGLVFSLDIDKNFQEKYEFH